MQRFFRIVAIGTLVCLICAALPAEAQYRYGKYRYSSSEQGWFVFAEMALPNPRNADTVVATFEQMDGVGGQNATYPVIPPWSDDPAGRTFEFAGQVSPTSWTVWPHSGTDGWLERITVTCNSEEAGD